MILKTAPLVYFAFPKCASELIREALESHIEEPTNNEYDKDVWSQCDINYHHVKPSRFLEHHQNLMVGHTIMTTIRNPYDRIVSAFVYLKKHKLTKCANFKKFVHTQHTAFTNNTFQSLPLCWMYMPFEMYFEGIDLGKMVVFKSENLAEMSDYLANHNILLDHKRFINTTRHNDYNTFYDDVTRKLVQNMFMCEIQRFGYNC